MQVQLRALKQLQKRERTEKHAFLHNSYPWVSTVAFKQFMFLGDVVSLSKISDAISLFRRRFEVESISSASDTPCN